MKRCCCWSTANGPHHCQLSSEKLTSTQPPWYCVLQLSTSVVLNTSFTLSHSSVRRAAPDDNIYSVKGSWIHHRISSVHWVNGRGESSYPNLPCPALISHPFERATASPSAHSNDTLSHSHGGWRFAAKLFLLSLQTAAAGAEAASSDSSSPVMRLQKERFSFISSSAVGSWSRWELWALHRLPFDFPYNISAVVRELQQERRSEPILVFTVVLLELQRLNYQHGLWSENISTRKSTWYYITAKVKPKSI